MVHRKFRMIVEMDDSGTCIEGTEKRHPGRRSSAGCSALRVIQSLLLAQTLLTNPVAGVAVEPRPTVCSSHY